MQNNYRQSRHTKRTTASLDGFVSSTGNLDPKPAHFKKRFTKHYQPVKSDSLAERRDVSRISEQKHDGFYARNSRVDQSYAEVDSQELFSPTLDMSLSDDVYRPPGLAGKKPRKHKRKHLTFRKIARSFAVILVALVVAVGSLFGYAAIKSGQVFRGNGEGAAALDRNVDPTRLNGEGDGRVNILLLGKGGAGETAPDLTDTLMLVSIDPVSNEAALLSVPRDLYVRVDGASSKINAVYSNAKQNSLYNDDSEDVAEDKGLDAIKETVSDVIGLPIHYYVMVNFKAFEDAINAVGGITIDVKEPLVDYSMAWLNNWNPVLAEQGIQIFDGKRALYYARSRYGSSDFARSERQREILIALQQKIMSAGTFSNPIKVVELLNAFGNNVRTDLNGVNEVQRLYEIGKNISGDRVVSVGLTDDPVLVVTDAVGDQSIVRPIAGLYEYDDIRSFVRNTLRDAFLKQENSRIVILNGTDVAGLATAKQIELKSYGYNVVSVDNAPTGDYTRSRLIKLNTEHRYTESYLSRRIGLTAEETVIEGLPTLETADFVIIVGSDEASQSQNN